MHFAMQLGGNNDFVALCEVLQRAPEDLLTHPN